MKPLYKKIRLCILTAVTVVLLNGCFFGDSLSISFTEDLVVISVTGVSIGSCEDNGDGTFECITAGLFSAFETLSLPELIFRLVLLDPLVVQFPADVSNFNGSFLNNDSGTGGALVITPGLTSVPIDVDRTLNAEPGTQLVVIGLPDAAATTGNFSFNLNFSIPPGTSELEVKPIITGLVELTDGSTFYPPVLPCVDDMSSAPALNIPIPVPGDTFTLPPLTPDLGCNNVTYNFIPDGTIPSLPPTAIPALGPWSLLVLTTLLGGAGGVWLRRHRADSSA